MLFQMLTVKKSGHCMPKFWDKLNNLAKPELRLVSLNLTLRVLLISLIALGMTSCSILGWNSSKSVNLASKEIKSLELHQLSRKPYVYKITDPNNQQVGNVYFTTIEDCSLNGNLSATAIMRQLFVGFEDLNITEQSEVRIENSPVFVTTIKASLENKPLIIRNYATRVDKCVVDVVFWCNDEDSGKTIDIAESTASRILKSIINTKT